MTNIKKFELSAEDKKAIASAFKRFSDALLSASDAAKNFTKASKMINDSFPTAKQASKNLKINKPYYRANDRY